jgi:hypothetical protein
MSKQVQSTTSPSLTPGDIHDWYPFQTFSEDLAVDLEAVLVQGHQEGVLTDPINQGLCPHRQQWHSVNNTVAFTHGGHKGTQTERARGPYQVTYVLCQTVGAAQRMASLLNHYKVLAPTTW